ncbi:MAG: aminoglycoside phosphotransferase family protein [Dermatophilaceae bacterium]
MNLPRRPDLDPRALLTRLDPVLADASITELGEGWDNVAYAVDPPSSGPLVSRDRLVLRVSKFTEAAERRATAARDDLILRVLAAHTDVQTNRLLAALPDEGALLLTAVAGVPVAQTRPRDDARLGAALGRVLAQVHAVPVEGLDKALGTIDSEGWLAHRSAEVARVADRLGERDREMAERFLNRPAPRHPERIVLCHNDLGEDHIFVDPESQELTGIIDWSDAMLGDPARDFALVLFDLGDAALEAALAAYGSLDQGLAERTTWYAACAGLAGAASRLEAGDEPGAAETFTRVRQVVARFEG